MVMLAPCQVVMYESGNVSTMPGSNTRIWLCYHHVSE